MLWQGVVVVVPLLHLVLESDPPAEQAQRQLLDFQDPGQVSPQPDSQQSVRSWLLVALKEQ